LIGGLTAVFLSSSLHPASVAEVAIAPSGRNGMLANQVSTSRRVCRLAEFVITLSEYVLEFSRAQFRKQL